jgi:hypothetical protein
VAAPGKQRSKATEDPPYGRYAFLNPYNLSLLAGTAAAAAATGHWWLAVCGVAVESMWMLFAPDSKVLQKTWFDKLWKDEQNAERDQRRRAKLGQISPPYQQRIGLLYEQKQRIEQLALENPSVTTALLKTELDKLESLIDDFLELCIVCVRCERHLGSFNFPEMERSWQMYEGLLGTLKTADPRREIAQKNLEVLKQRRHRWEEVQTSLQTTRGQMDLMEQTFSLLADEIVVDRPLELGVRLDELRVGVDAARSAGDTANDDEFVELEHIEDEAEHQQRRAR